MTLKDKLEIGLKEDAPYRKDNLPENQVRGPEIPAGEGRSPEIPAARNDHNIVSRKKSEVGAPGSDVSTAGPRVSKPKRPRRATEADE